MFQRLRSEESPCNLDHFPAALVPIRRLEGKANGVTWRKEFYRVGLQHLSLHSNPIESTRWYVSQGCHSSDRRKALQTSATPKKRKALLEAKKQKSPASFVFPLTSVRQVKRLLSSDPHLQADFASSDPSSDPFLDRQVGGAWKLATTGTTL